MIGEIDFLGVLLEAGIPFALVVIFSLIAKRFLDFLDNQQKSDLAERTSWDEIRRSDNQQWISLITGLKMSIDAQVLAQGEQYKVASTDRVANMAYQSTSSTALVDLLTISKELRGVPANLRVANDALIDIGKAQRRMMEDDTRTELQMKLELSKTNNALLEMKQEMKKMTGVMEQLPDNIKAIVAPFIEMVAVGISTAQAQVQVDSVVEKELFEGVSPPPSPLPTGGEGEDAPIPNADGMYAVPTNTGEANE